MADVLGFEDMLHLPGDRYRSPAFGIRRDDDSSFRVILEVSGTIAAMLALRLGGSPHDDATQQVMDRGLRDFTAIRIEAGLRGGEFEDAKAGDVVSIHFQEADIDEVLGLLGEKICSYQVDDDGDLYCSAAALNDETQVGTIGLRVLAPTSRLTCRKCDLPATTIICSHLAHPAVWGSRTMGDVGSIPPREVKGAACELNRPEIRVPANCRPGANGCWKRIILAPRHLNVEVTSPQALPDALDFLDTAWRLTHSRRALFQMKSFADAAGLVGPCRTREEFKSRVSELDDILKKMDIPNEDLPSGTSIPKAETLNRLRASLTDPQTGIDADADAAIEILRHINGLRVGYQHSGGARDVPGIFEKLGVANPTLDWQETWDTVRSAATGALLQLARVLRRAVS